MKRIIAFTALAISLAFGSAMAQGSFSASFNTTGGQPDITNKTGITIGPVNGQWNGSITVSAKQSSGQVGSNKWNFRFSYQEINIGNAATNALFNNRILVDNVGVVGQAGQSLAAGQSKQLTGLIPLTLGSHVLTLILDDANSVAESNEGNNKFSLHVTVVP